MASETYDYEPFGNTEHSMKQIADAIRHKGYGKDVREAIAEGIEQFDQVKGEVFRRVKAVEDDNATLNARVDKLSDNLAAEAQTRAEADKELDGKIKQSEDRLSKRITASEDRLNERITNHEKITDERLDKIEKLLYGENPQLIEGDQGDHEPPNPHVVEITS